MPHSWNVPSVLRERRRGGHGGRHDRWLVLTPTDGVEMYQATVCRRPSSSSTIGV